MQNEALAAKAYGNPFGFAVEYGLDTLPRQALQRAQDEAQVTLLSRSRSGGG
jgi:SIT family siderophore-iron:H+ symporter-like MFS transporter